MAMLMAKAAGLMGEGKSAEAAEVFHSAANAARAEHNVASER
eukprot:CAMPEP_0114165122 /NCGR_PEP_ID=MMETSP0043_2-20121206/31067_1 /TAXON_ID=464988 /ORGANISM="Hemiselmis andersenii, Strain CCMP644" /LENGTH=41 /DNA_ID= /DNA_START= /DNA_END= /DNA_ORIENTATION=